MRRQTQPGQNENPAPRQRPVRFYWTTAGLSAILVALIAGSFQIYDNMYESRNNPASGESETQQLANPAEDRSNDHSEAPGEEEDEPPELTPTNTIELPHDYGVDLDTGAVTRFVGTENPAVDLTYGNYFSAASQWDPETNVQMAVIGTDPATPTDCTTNTRFTDFVYIDTLRIGSQFCLRTTEDRLLLLTITAPPDNSSQPRIVAFSVEDSPSPEYDWRTDQIQLPNDYGVDLDTGAVTRFVGAENPAVDLTYGNYFSAASQWDQETNVQMAVIGTDPATHTDCTTNTRFTDFVYIDTLRIGSQFCLRTTEDRLLLLTITAPPDNSDQPRVVVFTVEAA